MAQDRRRCLIVPAAGLGTRFAAVGYKNPKPFIEIHNVPMVELVIRNLRSLIGACRVVVVLRDETRGFASALAKVEGCDVVFVPELTQGAASTVLHALQHVDDDEEVIVANSDQIVDFDPSAFDKASLSNDGVIVTFTSEDRNPKWSYAALDGDGKVARVAEKDPISDVATVGVYHYRSARMLKDAIHAMIDANDRTNGEFYLCPVYNHLPPGSNVVTVPTSVMYGLGTPEDLGSSLKDEAFVKLANSLTESKGA